MKKEEVKEIQVAIDDGHEDALLSMGDYMYNKGIIKGYMYMAFATTAAWLLAKCMDSFEGRKLKKELEEEES